jgi:hypothetical protein
VSDEISAIIEEINEEVKNDRLMAFVKKYKKPILALMGVLVVGIAAYSSWYSRKNQQMAEITNALLDVLQSPSSKNHTVMESMAEEAPTELKPFLTILKSGRKLASFQNMSEALETLLILAEKRGVDIIWKDLAVILYVSYNPKPADELIKMLEPLTRKERPFRFTATEFIALNLAKAGDDTRAEEYMKRIIDDERAPKTMKRRILLMLNHMKNHREKK